MGSKRKGGVCDLPSSSEEDEGSVRRKMPVLKTFRIHSTEYVTSSNRDEKKKAAVKIYVNTTEGEIREMLIRDLPQLRGKRFTFFTKDKAGKWYICPCSFQCEGKDHLAEWNGRNIPRAAKSNRAVYILIESTTVEETRSGRVQNDTPTNPVPSDSQLRGSLGNYSSNLLKQKEGRVPTNHQSVSCPDLSLSGLEHQKNTSVRPLLAYHGNDLNQRPTQLTQPSQEQTETEYEKVKDGGVTEEKYGEGEGRIDISDEEMQTDVCNNDEASTSENASPQKYLESGYDTFPSENNAIVLVDPANSVQDEESPTFFVNISPPLDTNLNGTSLHPTPTEFMQIFQDFPRTPREIKEIVPNKGNVAGGETFYLSLTEACNIHNMQVQFGPSRVPVERCGNKDFKGIVPPYPEADVVQVYLVNNNQEKISISKPFEYVDPDKEKEDFVKKAINSTEDFEEMLVLLSKKVGKINLNSNETKDSQGTNQPGGSKTQALSLLYMIANTAAMLNAIDFYRIIFSTQVGHSVFKSCKDAQTPLEEIARENGHEELARLLEQKHSMYQDDENESDGEVDWKELARAIEKYQTLKGESAEKKSIPSTSSSEQIQGYLGDGESSTSLSSLHLLDVESCTESTFEDQQTTQESMCGEEPNTCQPTAAESCPESTFEEQQTTPESTCGEEPDTCQTIAAEGCPENTLEEQETIPKSSCREKPDTCQTSGRIARGLIQDGMSDTDIINTTTSSSDQLRKNKAHQIRESQSSIGEKNLLANKYLNPLHLAGSGPIIMKNFQMDKFAPKEVSSLRRKLGSFDAAKMNRSALYPDRDQTICNLMERLDAYPKLDFLEELNKQDLTGSLKAQKGSKHPETAEKELYHTKGKGATVINTESITSVYSPLHSKVESGVEIAAVAGSATNISSEEQSTKEEISQDAISFEEHFFKKRFISAIKCNRKLVSSSLVLILLLIVVVCLPTIFTLRGKPRNLKRASKKNPTPSTWVEPITTSRQACSNGLLTLLCEGVTNVNAVHKVQWKIKFPETGWNEFSYCGKSGMNCVVTRPELPEGIRVVKVSNRSVNLQRVVKKNTNGYAQTMCQVIYSNNSRTSHVYKINFTAKCVRIHECRDLNLTKILQSLVQCKRAVDIEWYSINGSKFAYCSTCQDCNKISEVNREHVFWNRLQVIRDSLLLTAIQESDDGRTIRVKVHMKASGKSTGRETAHMYTIWIFVNTSRPPVPEKENKSICGSPVPRVNLCNSETQFLVEHEDGSTSCKDCPACPPGQTLSTECGKKVLSSVLIKCEPCKLGMSFSSKYGTSVCTPCSSCAKDQVVAQNCTLTQDIKCHNRCYGKDRYYDDAKGGCFPCAKCCQDEQDIVENECKERLGTGSNMICSFHSSINRCDESRPFPQEPTTTTDQSTTSNGYTTPSQVSKHEHTMLPTAQPSHHFSQTKTAKHRDLPDLLIAVSIFVPLIIIISIAVCLYIHIARLTGCYSWCNCNTETGVAEMENGEYSTSRVHYKPTKENLDMLQIGLVKTSEVNHGILPSESREPLLRKGNQEELSCSCQQESKLLSSLLDDQPYLEAVSECLDTTLAGAGDYRAVAQNYGLSHYTISSVLEKNDGGPTTALIEYLAATQPKVTVQAFTAVVRQKAKRKDVAYLLEAYDSGKKLGDV